ncbi:MAG: CDP-alcohol phosphatidyltransferase family protein [Acidimicrobiia bacterium]|nr:CDP-alcohol phosphatidyltransferase family protein [Acidimicrobiia bacterium]
MGAENDVETNEAGFVVHDRVLTLPNVITFVRIGLTPVFLVLLLQERWLAAAILFVIVSGTDFIDGRLARRWDQVTRLGTVLDPVADRLLILSAAIAVVVKGIMPLWLIGLIVLREVTVAAWTIYLKGRGIQLEVVYVGKWAATLVFTSVPGFILATALADMFGWQTKNPLWWLSLAIGCAGVVCGFIANWSYLTSGRRLLAADPRPGA